MTAGTRPAARKLFAPARRDCVRGYAFNGTDFIVKSTIIAAHQLVRPPLNSNSEFTDELL
jgi:hypothetical protein